MNNGIATAAVLAVIGLTGLAAQPARADDAATPAAPAAIEKCYGIALHGHNDCAAGTHSCAGQATRDRDPKSFVELPVGACSKIAGGKLKAA